MSIASPFSLPHFSICLPPDPLNNYSFSKRVWGRTSNFMNPKFIAYFICCKNGKRRVEAMQESIRMACINMGCFPHFFLSFIICSVQFTWQGIGPLLRKDYRILQKAKKCYRKSCCCTDVSQGLGWLFLFRISETILQPRHIILGNTEDGHT